MRYYILTKDNFDKFIVQLAKKQKVIAPTARGNSNFSFEEVTTGKEIALNYLPTILPIKKYFMPQREVILEYDKHGSNNMSSIVEYDDYVLFGLHTCDLAGVQCLNMVFSDRPKDPNYLLRKNKMTIIGLECSNYCDQYASCALVDNHTPNGGYDLFFTDLGIYFMIQANTKTGEDLLTDYNFFQEAEPKHHKALEDFLAKKRDIFKSEVGSSTNRVIDAFTKGFESKVWEDIGSRCISCGNCTNVCPTCYCFNLTDDISLDGKKWQRIRSWDSCQNETFAKVAGGESFREDRKARQRHRYYRKFKYPIDRFSRFFCTGCGRCSRTCMAKINLKETLMQLVKENA